MDKKIDKKDIAILLELSKNSRIPLSKIAKIVKIPKTTVKYRIEKLSKRKILNKNYAIIDMTKLGFLFHYEIFVKLQGISEELEKSCLNKLKDHPLVGWLVSTSGRYSFICATFARHPSHLYEIVKYIKSLFHPFIQESFVNVAISGEQYRYPIFKYSESPKISTKNSFSEFSPIKLPRSQIKILKILSENSRTSLTEIAKKLKLTEKTVSARIKKLEKEKIITNYTCQLHLGRSGYFFYVLLIKLNDVNEEIKLFLEQFPEIFYIVKSVGSYDLKTGFYVAEEPRIYEIEREIYKKFGKVISETEIMRITKEYYIRYFTDV